MGMARMKPRVTGMRGPRLSDQAPTRGAAKVGRINGRNVRPAPRDDQPKRALVRRGRTASQDVRMML